MKGQGVLPADGDAAAAKIQQNREDFGTSPLAARKRLYLARDVDNATVQANRKVAEREAIQAPAARWSACAWPVGRRRASLRPTSCPLFGGSGGRPYKLQRHCRATQRSEVSGTGAKTLSAPLVRNRVSVLRKLGARQPRHFWCGHRCRTRVCCLIVILILGRCLMALVKNSCALLSLLPA